uniref:NADH-ubiquinone oxidoreductase chain 6 n=1 Tax=Phalacridae gen. sp. MJ-2020 TaxID=2762523 RepID=A0A7G7MU54_9CUCU|nr:NADH dehydrogenase subunit 6 [Phalacridae gen. sp. MJ-2020]
MTMLMYNLWMLSLIFMLMKHPLSMGLILLLQTISISMISGFMMFNFWYSYMLFLIMIGGMLVLFLYMTNVASNEKFKFSIKIFFLLLSLTFLFLLSIWMFNIKNNMMFSFNEIYIKLETNNNFLLSLNKYLNFPFYSIYLMLMVYLLITLIAIVKITNIKYGPLRPSY